MNFGIFKMVVDKTKGKPLSVTFEALMNPVDQNEILRITGENPTDAAKSAAELLATFQAETHTVYGDHETGIGYFPDYFVGELLTREAGNYVSSVEYRVSNFTPVPKIPNKIP